jgi:hypothetical protein
MGHGDIIILEVEIVLMPLDIHEAEIIIIMK